MAKKPHRPESIDAPAALIYAMVLVSASDRDMTDAELMTIGDIVRHLPMFRGFDLDNLHRVAETCANLLSGTDGLDATLNLIRNALPGKLRETAYALACDVAAADVEVHQEELRILQLLRERLEIDRLVSAAIERAARARHTTL